MWEALRPIRRDDAAVKAYGVELAASLARNVLDAGAPGLHFYTLNLERSVNRILGTVGLVREPSRSLPWRPSAHAKRQSEDVRPIFWANRPESYLSRTSSWDEFPNGRWGDARSPAYGEPEHHLLGDAMGRPEERRAIWGEALAGEGDVREVFARYVTGQIPRLPWCATQLASETTVIQETLARMNRHGFLTINSQPRVAGAPSDDPTFGWGGPGGLVYQKAYVEFFCSPETLRDLMHTAAGHPSIVYHASDASGNTYTNAKKKVRAGVARAGCAPAGGVSDPSGRWDAGPHRRHVGRVPQQGDSAAHHCGPGLVPGVEGAGRARARDSPGRHRPPPPPP